jgi:hypothetical protein
MERAAKRQRKQPQQLVRRDIQGNIQAGRQLFRGREGSPKGRELEFRPQPHGGGLPEPVVRTGPVVTDEPRQCFNADNAPRGQVVDRLECRQQPLTADDLPDVHPAVLSGSLLCGPRCEGRLVPSNPAGVPSAAQRALPDTSTQTGLPSRCRQRTMTPAQPGRSWSWVAFLHANGATGPPSVHGSPRGQERPDQLLREGLNTVAAASALLPGARTIFLGRLVTWREISV